MTTQTPPLPRADRAPQDVGGPGIDPRGPQFNAALTSVVLAATLLTAPGTLGVALLGGQALLFATAVVLGVQRTPAAFLFRHLVRPRLGPPSHLEDPRPPRFAQAVGLVFALVGLAGFLAGAPLLGSVATGLALTAALLNALFGFCLGCEVYLLLRRTIPARRTHTTTVSTAGHAAGPTKEEEAFA